MDSNGLVLLSKFSVSARRLIGAVNPAKLIKDSEYSADVFQKAFELGDEELIMLALEVQTMLGLLAISAPTASATKVAPIKTVIAEDKKYMFGARS